MAVLAAPKRFLTRHLLALSMLPLLTTFVAPPAVYAEEPIRLQLSQTDGADPLKGLDLQQLESEKQRLTDMKSSPEFSALLSVVPGAGHFYSGQNERGAWVLGGFAGTLLLSFLGSYLLSSINNDIARTAAVVVNVAPTSAYWVWSMSDAYYQTSLRNQDLDRQIHDISLKQREYGYYSTLLQLHF